MNRSTAKPAEKAEFKLHRSPTSPAHNDRLSEALDLMRGVIRSPLGSNPERDEKIRAVWHSGATLE